MMSNLKSARQSIEAELSHAREGAAYYAARVEALESALHQLENVDAARPGPSSTAASSTADGSAGNGAARRGRKARKLSAKGAPVRNTNGKARAGKRAGAKAGGAFPSTGGDFWLKLIGTEPQSAVDISNAAAAALGIAADQKAQIQILKQRVSPALASLVSARKIQDTGAGRERRFFKSGDQAA